MIKLLKRIREIDRYGFPISLNFDEKGPSHNTLFGGILTLIFYMYIIIYISFGINKIVNHGQDNYVLYNQAIDLGSLGEVNYKDTQF